MLKIITATGFNFTSYSFIAILYYLYISKNCLYHTGFYYLQYFQLFLIFNKIKINDDRYYWNL